LRKQGFEVETVNSQDLKSIKDKYQIPKNMESCHTMVIGDYFIEGHVPIDEVINFLEEKPDVDGVSLPRMPSGTPGMPGPKTEPWTIYHLTNGQYSERITI